MSDQLNHYSAGYVLKNICVMKYSPTIRHRTVQKRPVSSFLHIVCGTYHYTSDAVDFYAESGDTVYLPQSATYAYTVLSEETECIQVEFELEMQKNGLTSHKRFSEHPVFMKGRDKTLNFIFHDLLNTYYRDEFSTVASVYKLLSICENIYGEHGSRDESFGRIEPAIKYIEQNFDHKIYISELAKLCDISQSHLRRLFHLHLRMSPVKYKNSILMKTACNMLCNENLNVSETAEALHFSDIYTFSQLFKKEIGLSPKKYMELYKKSE